MDRRCDVWPWQFKFPNGDLEHVHVNDKGLQSFKYCKKTVIYRPFTCKTPIWQVSKRSISYSIPCLATTVQKKEKHDTWSGHDWTQNCLVSTVNTRV